MSPLSLNVTRRIMDDLSNDGNVKKRRNNQDFTGEPVAMQFKNKSMKMVKMTAEAKKCVGNKEDLFTTMLSKFELMFLKQKLPKEVKKTMEKKKESKEDHLEAVKKVVTKIEKLSGKLTLSEIEKFLDGVAVSHLKEAESSFGRNLKRLDRVWWFLLVRDFSLLPDGFASDPRSQYFEEVRKQKQKNDNLFSFISREPVASF